LISSGVLDHTRSLVQAFDPAKDARAAEARRQILALLEAGAAAFRRNHFDPGHITASAIVLRERIGQREVLLVLHRRLDRWLQPGGHVDPDDTDVIAAARREVREETGVVVEDSADLVGVDVHGIPAGRGEPPHFHHDLVFLMTPRTSELVVSEESREVRWCPVDALGEMNPDAALRSAVQRALQR
jgi:8-oxo-dGTP pyrophosphatase MutT (NUDIX family)